ncbi:two-component system sensor histidine kinase NtrB [Paracoccus saliphilus]|uniref:histidine kinase n=1 Tax=Paracoccus saliphilus TaxID=405559 RepID=A0AA46A6W4_9RHOB|nr:ATP-binding protein [Paracoccus saliphilus]WCR03772.1 PAS domain-containing sensor histidine kinase [Paracoccus saliphilus]SIT04525.1 two-component system, NtrC family, nitrogen regulation sensor histidine kinase GlnL [Paracoccus saliphilus]
MTCPPPADFREAKPGPGWLQLPLPALILDEKGRVGAMNDAAEIWLNLSRNSTVGRPLDSDDMVKRLRILPSLGPLFNRVTRDDEALYQPGVQFEIGDRAGGHQTRRASVHAGPAEGIDGAASILIVPEDDGGMLYQSRAVRSAARSAIGMSEMLAHEIKNPLAGIRGAAQLMAMNAPPEDREMAEMIVSESRRIVSLLEQVERFGDTSAPRLAPVNVHDVLEQVRRSATVGFAKEVSIITDYDPSLPHALADADQLVQVCLNLVKNAAEALTDRPDGTIRLRSSYDHSLRLPPDDTWPKGRALPLQIEIEDNGPGLPSAIAEQVFEPFVSGRENGTGLGLALVSKIVTDHGALIRVDSRPGRTLFRISLPKA